MVAVNEIAKHPKIINDVHEIIYIQDKRKNKLALLFENMNFNVTCNRISIELWV